MSYYYWFKRKDLLKKAHEKYHNKGGKEKAAEYDQENAEMIKRRGIINFYWLFGCNW